MAQMLSIADLLSQIDNHIIQLPVFQRGYVWSRNQVRELFSSLYKKYPIGSILVWQTKSQDAEVKGAETTHFSPRHLLLDGQQRMTSLYGVIRGSEPGFFDGDAKVFTGLYFHLDEEVFEFYQPAKMKSDPLWIDVSRLFLNGKTGIHPLIKDIESRGANVSECYGDYYNRLSTLLAIDENIIIVDLIVGEDKTLDVVIDIFDRVNSKGTKLSDGDLALATISAEWPEARESMQSALAEWEEAGYNFNLDWLLRVMNAVISGKANFDNLRYAPRNIIMEGLDKSKKYIDEILNLVSSRLGLDHSRVLFAKNAFPVIASLLHNQNKVSNIKQRDRLLYWYVQAGMWGRFSGSTLSTIEQDLSIISDSKTEEDSIGKLIEALRLSRGGLHVEAQNFHGSTRGARFYSVLYMLTRMGEAQDFYEGLPLKKSLLGKMAQLELHHIFPQARLKAIGCNKQEINALANFCFLTKDSNLKIGKRLPEDYFNEIDETNPGSLESQWIPMDRNLWKLENYFDFLEARKLLLARATNELLSGLFPEHGRDASLDAPIVQRPPSVSDEEEEAQINEINKWIREQGLQSGVIGHELFDSNTGEQIAILDLAWPDGVQSELSEPVALLINEGVEVLSAAGSQGYRFFTDSEGLKSYIENEILFEVT